MIRLNNSTRALLAGVAVTLAASGCADDAGDVTPDQAVKDADFALAPDRARQDAAAPDAAAADAAALDDQQPLGCTKAQYQPSTKCGAHPKGPYGTQLGQVLGPFDPALKDCKLKGVKLRSITCSSKLVLVSIGAGWCKPCVDEMPALVAAHAKFCGRGLGMVNILYQDTKHQIPTSAFCANWQTTFKTPFPVLLDQLEQTKQLMNYATGTPLNLLIETKTMKVLHRWSGKVPTDLEQTIEAELKQLGL